MKLAAMQTGRPAKRWWIAIFLAASMAVGGCNQPGGPSGPGKGQGPGGRQQTLALKPQQEYALGAEAYRDILSKSQMVTRGPELERVRRIGNKIAKAAEIESLQREIRLRVRGYRFDWEFNIIQDRQVNAFCLPGGKVAVYSGLLPVVANDSQLATVMAHEIAHALAHHGSERLARQRASGGGFLDILAHKHHSRAQESEADHIGVFLMTFAGYDPQQAVIFWQRMRQASVGSQRPPEILSDHPNDAQRIAQIGTWIAPAKAAKRAFDEGRILPPPPR